MRMTGRYVVMVILSLFFAVGGFAQRSKESLEKEVKALQKDIATANKLLKETSKSKEVTLNQVSLMDKKYRCWRTISRKARRTSKP